MTDDEAVLLRKEMATLLAQVTLLRAEVDDIGRAFRRESTDTSKHLKAIYRYIADIHDYLMPILYKVFPGYVAAKKQIDDFMATYGSPKDSK